MMKFIEGMAIGGSVGIMVSAVAILFIRAIEIFAGV
jgi:hypothetical protein